MDGCWCSRVSFPFGANGLFSGVNSLLVFGTLVEMEIHENHGLPDLGSHPKIPAFSVCNPNDHRLMVFSNIAHLVCPTNGCKCFQTFFKFSPRSLGKSSNLTSIFFKWVGSNHHKNGQFSGSNCGDHLRQHLHDDPSGGQIESPKLHFGESSKASIHADSDVQSFIGIGQGAWIFCWKRMQMTTLSERV